MDIHKEVVSNQPRKQLMTAREPPFIDSLLCAIVRSRNKNKFYAVKRYLFIMKFERGDGFVDGLSLIVSILFIISAISPLYIEYY